MSRPTSIEIVVLYDEDPRNEDGEILTCLPDEEMVPIAEILHRLGMAVTELTVTTMDDGAVSLDLIAKPAPKRVSKEWLATYQKIDLGSPIKVKGEDTEGNVRAAARGRVYQDGTLVIDDYDLDAR